MNFFIHIQPDEVGEPSQRNVAHDKLWLSVSIIFLTHTLIDLYIYIYYIHIMEGDNSTIFSSLEVLRLSESRNKCLSSPTPVRTVVSSQLHLWGSFAPTHSYLWVSLLCLTQKLKGLSANQIKPTRCRNFSPCLLFFIFFQLACANILPNF